MFKIYRSLQDAEDCVNPFMQSDQFEVVETVWRSLPPGYVMTKNDVEIMRFVHIVK
jgi:hypothetical protein